MTWMLIKEAPLDTLGHVWCAELGDRTEVLGTVYAYDAHEDGGRGVSSTAKGFPFTHWHPLPSRPLPEGGSGDLAYFVPWYQNRSPPPVGPTFQHNTHSLGDGASSRPTMNVEDGPGMNPNPPSGRKKP